MHKALKKFAKQALVWGMAIQLGCHLPHSHFEAQQPAVATAVPPSPTNSFSLLLQQQHTMLEQIKHLATNYHQWVIQHRRFLHQHPELSGHEAGTQRYIMAQLDSLGIPYRTDVGIPYSVVVEINGRNPNGKRILLRADTDALPINELNEVPYKSQNEGISHKCGHDGHTSNLLGVARILHELRAQLDANYTLIWQPHEEKLPGGAAPMIAAGILEGVDACIGLHVDPNLEVGTVGLRSGAYMASIDELQVTCTGKGAHGGSGVHLSKDPILAMAYLLTSLEQIKAHNCPATTPMALSFGQIQGGHTFNVIPDTCTAKGTFRSLSDPWRMQAHTRMLEIAEGVGKSTGTHIDFHIEKGHPVLVNDARMTALAQACAEEALGAPQVIALDYWMASEDFSHFCQARPSVFLRLGVRNAEKGMTHGLHTALFDLDEDAFLTGMTVMAWTAVCAGMME